MKALVTSCGEKTTAVCIEQLKKLGFEVMNDDRRIPWHKKYRDFIEVMAQEPADVLRVDADVIVNEKVADALMFGERGYLMAQFQIFDFYKNDLSTGQPVWYSKHVFPIIKKHLKHIDHLRPETWAWRLAEVNNDTVSIGGVAGMHGFFQDEETMKRAKENKFARRQESNYDFELAEKLFNL